MGKADLHIHTIYSRDGTCSVKAVLKQAAHIVNLDVLAITDHDEIRGALEAMELASQYGIDVIPGSEVSTSDGHLLALFIREKIPAGLSLKETVLRVKEKGGLCIVPHPEARGPHSVNGRVLREAMSDNRIRQTLLGIESYNAGLFDKAANAKASGLAKELGLAKIGSSDSHLIWTIGQGATLFSGNRATDFYKALQDGRTVPYIGNRIRNAAMVLSWVRGHLLRWAGWIEYNRFPDAPVKLERIPSLARFAFANK